MKKPDKREKNIAPSTKPKAAKTGGDDPVYVSRAEMRRFSTEVALGKWKNKPKEQARVEAMIARATKNNWFTP